MGTVKTTGYQLSFATLYGAKADFDKIGVNSTVENLDENATPPVGVPYYDVNNNNAITFKYDDTKFDVYSQGTLWFGRGWTSKYRSTDGKKVDVKSGLWADAIMTSEYISKYDYREKHTDT